ncbi:MAG: hypothetical protein PVI71_07365 [Desulfobacterales bacterium]|jgi:hypothetical protein
MKGRLFIAGIVMLAISPLLRLFEAIIRIKYMPDQYERFWSALSKDIWLINGWWGYIKTPIGKWVTIFIFSWLALAAVFIVGSIVLFYLKDN